MHVKIKGEPIRVTEQQHRYFGNGRNGRAVIVKGKRLKEAEEQLISALKPQAPNTPMSGPIALTVSWHFGTKDKHKLAARYKTTRPDTDNMLKLLKDCLTKCGYWHDDAQVCLEGTEKLWVPLDEATTEIFITEAL